METETIKLSLLHTGQYEARFYIYWDSLSYDEMNRAYSSLNSWEGNGTVRLPHYYEEIYIPADITRLHIRADAKVNMYICPWRTILEETLLAPRPKMSLTIHGSYLHPSQELVLLDLPSDAY